MDRNHQTAKNGGHTGPGRVAVGAAAVVLAWSLVQGVGEMTSAQAAPPAGEGATETPKPSPAAAPQPARTPQGTLVGQDSAGSEAAANAEAAECGDPAEDKRRQDARSRARLTKHAKVETEKAFGEAYRKTVGHLEAQHQKKWKAMVQEDFSGHEKDVNHEGAAVLCREMALGTQQSCAEMADTVPSEWRESITAACLALGARKDCSKVEGMANKMCVAITEKNSEKFRKIMDPPYKGWGEVCNGTPGRCLSQLMVLTALGEKTCDEAPEGFLRESCVGAVAADVSRCPVYELPIPDPKWDWTVRPTPRGTEVHVMSWHHSTALCWLDISVQEGTERQDVGALAKAHGRAPTTIVHMPKPVGSKAQVAVNGTCAVIPQWML